MLKKEILFKDMQGIVRIYKEFLKQLSLELGTI